MREGCVLADTVTDSRGAISGSILIQHYCSSSLDFEGASNIVTSSGVGNLGSVSNQSPSSRRTPRSLAGIRSIVAAHQTIPPRRIHNLNLYHTVLRTHHQHDDPSVADDTCSIYTIKKDLYKRRIGHYIYTQTLQLMITWHQVPTETLPSRHAPHSTLLVMGSRPCRFLRLYLRHARAAGVYPRLNPCLIMKDYLF